MQTIATVIGLGLLFSIAISLHSISNHADKIRGSFRTANNILGMIRDRFNDIDRSLSRTALSLRRENKEESEE